MGDAGLNQDSLHRGGQGSGVYIPVRMGTGVWRQAHPEGVWDSFLEEVPLALGIERGCRENLKSLLGFLFP